MNIYVIVGIGVILFIIAILAGLFLATRRLRKIKKGAGNIPQPERRPTIQQNAVERKETDEEEIERLRREIREGEQRLRDADLEERESRVDEGVSVEQQEEKVVIPDGPTGGDETGHAKPKRRRKSNWYQPI